MNSTQIFSRTEQGKRGERESETRAELFFSTRVRVNEVKWELFSRVIFFSFFASWRLRFPNHDNEQHFNTNLKDPIHHLLQSYLYPLQFRLVVEGRAVNLWKFIDIKRRTCSLTKGIKSNQTHLKAIVGPTSKLHFTTLIIKWEPRDIDFTRRLEYPRWHI